MPNKTTKLQDKCGKKMTSTHLCYLDIYGTIYFYIYLCVLKVAFSDNLFHHVVFLVQ